MSLRIVSVCILAVLIGSTIGKAQEKPPSLERIILDQRIVKVVYDTALLGTEIYNKGDHEGCYRLYQGSLMALQAVLDHRPKLSVMVRDRLSKAAKLKVEEAAFELRAGLDEIQHEIAPTADKKTLWDRLGGETAVKKMVHEIVGIAIDNPKVNFIRNKQAKIDLPVLEQHLVEYISDAAGGPLRYTGKDMKKAHEGMMITDGEFDALKSIILGVLKSHQVDPRDSDDLMARIEATRKDIVEVKPKQ
jgi:hemoglobin